MLLFTLTEIFSQMMQFNQVKHCVCWIPTIPPHREWRPRKGPPSVSPGGANWIVADDVEKPFQVNRRGITFSYMGLQHLAKMLERIDLEDKTA
ncbi:MAG: hypothetical protein ACYCXF_07510 [Thermoleophilia bacterium]